MLASLAQVFFLEKIRPADGLAAVLTVRVFLGDFPLLFFRWRHMKRGHRKEERGGGT